MGILGAAHIATKNQSAVLSKLALQLPEERIDLMKLIILQHSFTLLKRKLNKIPAYILVFRSYGVTGITSASRLNAAYPGL